MGKLKTRPAIILLSLFALRFVGDWVGVLRALSSEDADVETWLIVVSVTAIGAEKFTRGGLPQDLDDLETAMPQGQLSRCNLSSIAAATGLNRETVRRKANWLVSQGILEREDDGAIRASAAVAGSPEVRKLVRDLVDSATRLSSQLKAIEG